MGLEAGRGTSHPWSASQYPATSGLISSFFLPGEVPGKAVLLLVDTGCTTTFQAKHVFDWLPEAVRLIVYPIRTLMERWWMDWHCRFTGSVAEAYVRNLAETEIFIISLCKKDTILGMPFLVQQDCNMKFDRPMTVGGEDLQCTYHHRRPLSSK